MSAKAPAWWVHQLTRVLGRRMAVEVRCFERVSLSTHLSPSTPAPHLAEKALLGVCHFGMRDASLLGAK